MFQKSAAESLVLLLFGVSETPVVKHIVDFYVFYISVIGNPQKILFGFLLLEFYYSLF